MVDNTPEENREIDAALVARIAAGDPAAEIELCERYRRRLRLFLTQQTGDRDAAEDLCHDALMVLLRTAREGTLRNAHGVAGYVYSVCRNLSADWVIARRRTVATEPETLDRALSPGTELENGEVAGRRLLRERALERAFQTLRPRDRRALLLRYRHELPLAEVAALLEVSDAAARQIVDRARERLKDALLLA